MWKTTEQRR